MSNNSELEKQRRREKLCTYAEAAGHTVSGGLLMALMLVAEMEKAYLPAIASGLVGGWNMVLGIKKAVEATNMRQR